MSKAEVEALLRRGAYEVFQEDKAGELDRELHKFMEEDIDTILERRAKIVIHDASREGEGTAPANNFSKASFKSSRGASGDTKNAAEDIDIDDPDFWTKVVGPPSRNASAVNVASSRRAKRTYYYENGSDGDNNTDYSRNDSDCSYSYASVSSESTETSNITRPFGLIVSTSYKDEFLCSIQRRILFENRREWGGILNDNWDRDDVSSIINYLQRYGYPTDFSKISLQLSKDYNVEEVSVVFPLLMRYRHS